PDEGTALFEGPLDLYSVIQEGTAGFSYAIHFRVLEPDKIEAVIAEGQKDGTLNHVYGIYALGSVSNGESASVHETRVLTSGGLYENYGAYIDLLRSLDRFSGIDLSVSYDYGAEINAMASYYMYAERGLYGASVPTERLEAIRSWLDQNIIAYRDNILRKSNGQYRYVFGRGLAFYALGLDCMYRATGDDQYRQGLQQAVEILLDLRHDSGPSLSDSLKGGFTCNQKDSFLDCHAAALLALARAAFTLNDPRIPA